MNIVRDIDPNRRYTSVETAALLGKGDSALRNDRYYKRTSLKYIKVPGSSRVFYPGHCIIEYLESGFVDPMAKN